MCFLTKSKKVHFLRKKRPKDAPACSISGCSYQNCVVIQADRHNLAASYKQQGCASSCLLERARSTGLHHTIDIFPDVAGVRRTVNDRHATWFAFQLCDVELVSHVSRELTNKFVQGTLWMQAPI